MLAALVVSVRREQLKVLRTVIRRHMVPMMDDLTATQRAANHLLHHETVLPHIAVTVSLGMVGAKHQPVAALM